MFSLGKTNNTTLWQALRLFNFYRVILALGFIALIHLHIDINFFGGINEPLYLRASSLYLLASVLFFLCSITLPYQYEWQANVPIFVDIIALIVLMHASGGFISGIGFLLIVIVAAHSLLVPGKISLFSAAIAALGIIFEHSYTFLSQNASAHMYPQVGLLGLVIFFSSFVTNLLAIRARKSQIIVESQAYQLATIQQLNAHIVSAMHAGVLVLDNTNQIRLINLASKRLLGLQNQLRIRELTDLPVFFQQCFLSWQQESKSITYQMASTSHEVRLTFHHLGKGLPTGTLVFIYDAQEETRHAQELKLASLGQLTANIAHELRNPLGAASHAAQLLAESKILTGEDHYFVRMIKDSCDRMNTVIQNVLSLSRKSTQAQVIPLISWLKQFVKELSIPNIAHPIINLQVPQEELYVKIDPSQLTQILINLCENGLRYSLQKSGKPTLTLQIQTSENPSAIYLDVIDQGVGIPSFALKRIFEPFFTTEKSGSGLGLYIAKELSQMNGARLDYHSSHQGCQFRLTIPQGENA